MEYLWFLECLSDKTRHFKMWLLDVETIQPPKPIYPATQPSALSEYPQQSDHIFNLRWQSSHLLIVWRSNKLPAVLWYGLNDNNAL